MNPRALRLLRGSAVTATAVALSSAAHLAGGGGAPGAIGLLTAFVLGSILGTALLAGDRLTPLRTAATIAGGQLVFHGVFSWGAAAPGAASGSAHAGHLPTALPLTAALPADDASGMLLAHAVAGVLALAVLLLEQRLLDRLVATARRALARLVTAAPVPVLPALPPRIGRPADADRPTLADHRALVPRRGPPALLLPA
jgi:hypothetical protein